MMRYIYLLVFLALVAPVFGADIKGPDSVEPYQLIKLSAEGDFDSIVWDYPDSVSAEESQNSLIWTAKPGTYEIKAFGVKNSNGKFVLTKLKKKVIIKSPDPTPDPAPQPGQIKKIVIIEETSQRTRELAQILTSQSLRQTLKSKNIEFWVWDKDQPEAKAYVPLSNALPRAYALGADDRILNADVPSAILNWVK